MFPFSVSLFTHFILQCIFLVLWQKQNIYHLMTAFEFWSKQSSFLHQYELLISLWLGFSHNWETDKDHHIFNFKLFRVLDHCHSHSLTGPQFIENKTKSFAVLLCSFALSLCLSQFTLIYLCLTLRSDIKTRHELCSDVISFAGGHQVILPQMSQVIFIQQSCPNWTGLVFSSRMTSVITTEKITCFFVFIKLRGPKFSRATTET